MYRVNDEAVTEIYLRLGQEIGETFVDVAGSENTTIRLADKGMLALEYVSRHDLLDVLRDADNQIRYCASVEPRDAAGWTRSSCAEVNTTNLTSCARCHVIDAGADRIFITRHQLLRSARTVFIWCVSWPLVCSPRRECPSSPPTAAKATATPCPAPSIA